jgi:hypothetical protein
MGYRLSWLGCKTPHKSELLAQAGLYATTLRDDAHGAPFSWTELPTGWCILFSNDFDYASAEHLEAFAQNFEIVSCQVHEGIMYSAAASHLAVTSNGRYRIGQIGVASIFLSRVSRHPNSR